MKRRLKEEVGVPQGIVESAKKLFTEIVQEIEMLGFDDPIVNNTVKTFNINTNIKISDLQIKKVLFKVILDFYDLDEIRFLNAGFASPARTDYGKFVFINQNNVGFSTFKLTLALPENKEFTTDDISEFLKNNSTEFISTLSHELKHAFDAYKKDTESFSERTDYTTITQFGAFGLPSVKQFFHYLYLATNAEILVKPSEVASRMDSNEINKKQFLEFLLNDKTYEQFSYMYNLTFEKFFESVMTDKDKIVGIFNRSNIEVPNNDDELFNELLRYLYIELGNDKINLLSDMMIEDPMEGFFGFKGHKNDFYESMMKLYTKYENNPTKFFESEIKSLNFVGERMMKKLGKLYSIAKDDTSQSDIIKRIYNKVNHEER